MHLREILGFHSDINNVTILLLCEAKLLIKWLQKFRQTVTVCLWKVQTSKAILQIWYITKIFEMCGKPLANDEVI